MRHRIFNAAQGVIIYEVAGRADNEEVADVLVEDYLGGGPGISASQNDSKGMLSLRGFGSFGRGGLGGGDFVRDKAGITLLEFCKRVIRAHRGSGRLGGEDKRRETKLDEACDERVFKCTVHFRALDGLLYVKANNILSTL